MKVAPFGIPFLRPAVARPLRLLHPYHTWKNPPDILIGIFRIYLDGKIFRSTRAVRRHKKWDLDGEALNVGVGPADVLKKTVVTGNGQRIIYRGTEISHLTAANQGIAFCPRG